MSKSLLACSLWLTTEDTPDGVPHVTRIAFLNGWGYGLLQGCPIDILS